MIVDLKLADIEELSPNYGGNIEKFEAADVVLAFDKRFDEERKYYGRDYQITSYENGNIAVAIDPTVSIVRVEIRFNSDEEQRLQYLIEKHVYDGFQYLSDLEYAVNTAYHASAVGTDLDRGDYDHVECSKIELDSYRNLLETAIGLLERARDFLPMPNRAECSDDERRPLEQWWLYSDRDAPPSIF